MVVQEERDYIESNIPSVNEGKGLPFPPLKDIFRSVPFIALLLVHFGQNYGFYTLLSETPTYLNNIQHYSLTKVRVNRGWGWGPDGGKKS